MRTLILAGTLLAKPGEEPLNKQTIVIAEGHIQEVSSGYISPKAGDNLIDLSTHYVLPGLIDCHVHLTGEFGPQFKLATVEDSSAAIALRGANYARKTLNAGFTTVRDLGDMPGSADAIFALKRAIANGHVPGPRIFAAGSIVAPTGGHGLACGFRDDVNLLLDSSGRADGVDGCRAAVRRQISRGADFIKFVATGGVLTDTETGTGKQFFDDEFQAIISTAKMLGRRTTAHAHGADGIKSALSAGVDSIEHGTFMDDEAMEMMLRTNTVYVPTTLAGTTVAEEAQKGTSMPDAVRKKALEVGPQILQTLSRAHEAGIRIAFGTDSGVSPHGQNAREFSLMTEAGLSPMEAICAATVDAARHIGQVNKLGTIEAGKAADVIAVRLDPLGNIDALRDVAFVMKGGSVFKELSESAS